ncbi:VacJ family lipoprotein [Magnetovibrio sp. PR-2]|uniref:MlaA family lipoprotein n=1 Tax=Magnetovibrio sp. PR-2 TaxID=3120356 RepID=UPI002FCE2202
MYATHRTGLDDFFSGFMSVLRHKVLRLGAVLLLGFMVSACATAPDPKDSEAVTEYNEINDPLEPFNRAMFEFNRGLDTLVLRPVAAMYRGFVPPPLRDLVSNFLSNLKTPVILLNDVLQGETERAWNTFSRFAINTTVGILGFGDPATEMGYPAHKEDFGQTLATWGVDGGPYLVLPILGPSNPRDAVGKVVDVITDPIWHYAQNTDKEYIPNERFVADAVDFRQRNMEDIDDLEKTSLDYYAAVRSLYRQVRDDEINNGKSGTRGLPSMTKKNSNELDDMMSMEDPDEEDPILATKN